MMRKSRPAADFPAEVRGGRTPVRLALIDPLMPAPDATPVDYALFEDAVFEMQRDDAFADTVIAAQEEQAASRRAATLESLERRRMESPVERLAREEAESALPPIPPAPRSTDERDAAARRVAATVAEADRTLAAAAPALAAARAAADAARTADARRPAEPVTPAEAAASAADAAVREAEDTRRRELQARLAAARQERLQAEATARLRAEEQARSESDRLAAAERALAAAAAASTRARAEADRVAAEEARLRAEAVVLRHRVAQAGDDARSLVRRQARSHGPADAAAPAESSAASASASASASAPRADAPAAIRLGEVLVEARRLTPVDVEVVLMHQASQNRRFGEIAVNLGLVALADIDWALARQPKRPAPAGMLSAGLPASDELVLAHAPSGNAAHVIRDIAGQLLRGPAAARPVLAVVGVDVGEGKTYLAANLAVAMAQAGRRTLLIEGDLRRPRLASIFPMASASRGLGGVLCGQQRLADAIVMPAGLTAGPTLHLLPAGAAAADPLELLQLQAFEVLLERVAGHFDQILIDTPAMRHWSADTRQLATLAGQALVVGRPGRTRMDELDQLMTGLRRGGTTVAGLVMNAH